jgi:hypothetical protein
MDSIRHPLQENVSLQKESSCCNCNSTSTPLKEIEMVRVALRPSQLQQTFKVDRTFRPLSNYAARLQEITRDCQALDIAKELHRKLAERFNKEIVLKSPNQAGPFSKEKTLAFYYNLLKQPSFENFSEEDLKSLKDTCIHPFQKNMLVLAGLIHASLKKRFDLVQNLIDKHQNFFYEEPLDSPFQRLIKIAIHLCPDTIRLQPVLKLSKKKDLSSHLNSLEFIRHLNPSKSIFFALIENFHENSVTYGKEAFIFYSRILAEPLFDDLSSEDCNSFIDLGSPNVEKMNLLKQALLYKTIITKQFPLMKAIILSMSDTESQDPTVAQLLSDAISFCPYLSLNQLLLIEQAFLSRCKEEDKKQIYEFYVNFLSHRVISSKSYDPFDPLFVESLKRIKLLGKVLDGIHRNESLSFPYKEVLNKLKSSLSENSMVDCPLSLVKEDPLTCLEETYQEKLYNYLRDFLSSLG